METRHFDWDTASSFEIECMLASQARDPGTPVWVSKLIGSRFGHDPVKTANWLEELATSYRYLADAVNRDC